MLQVQLDWALSSRGEAGCVSSTILPTSKLISLDLSPLLTNNSASFFAGDDIRKGYTCCWQVGTVEFYRGKAVKSCFVSLPLVFVVLV